MLSEPHWLLLIIPLVFLVYIFKPESKIILNLRFLLIIVICLALSSPIMKISGKEGVVVVVADRSASMPDDIDKRIQETTTMLLEKMPSNSRLALVSYTDKAKIEFSPTKNDVSALSIKQNPDSSNMADGIEMALTMIPDAMSGRIILVSDGLWNGQDPQNAVVSAANRNIPIDYRYIGRDIINDLAISYFYVPSILEPGESFIIRAGVSSPLEQDASIELLAGENSIFKTNYHLKSGINEISFNMRAPNSSTIKYTFKAMSSKSDSQLQNNTAQAVTLIKGKKPVLIISENPNSTMREFFVNNKILVDEKQPKQFKWTIEDLSGYSAVILEDVAADKIGFSGMHSLTAWVKHMGGGLLITGGKHSYGSGGYHKSPLDEALPVSMEMRSKTRKMSIAIAVVMDRSGSMSMSVGGRTKMDLANLAAASSLDLLMDDDEFGVFAVDTNPHLIVPLQHVNTKDKWRNDILSIRSQGGGIYVYDGINAAVEMLRKAESVTRHIILFSDACDSEKPGTYWELLSKAQSEGMTLSVIGLGKETDSDGPLLRKIAEAGKGRCFFTNEPEDLPRLFSQDTFMAVKNTYVEKTIDIHSDKELGNYIGNNKISFKSSVDAYNICYTKPEASQIISTTDEDETPILSVWQYGLGKVACYTGVLSKEKGGKFLNTDFAFEVFNGLYKWLAFDDREVLGEIMVSQKIVNGRWKSYLNLDPERLRDPFSDTPVFEIISSVNGAQPKIISKKAAWENADQLSVSHDLVGNEVIAPLLKINDKKTLRLAPACQIYSPEFLPQNNRTGASELKQIAKITGGTELIDLSTVWATMPLVTQDRNVSNYWFTLALILFLLEIAERRMALLTIAFSKIRNLKNKKATEVKPIENNKVEVPDGKTLSHAVELKVPEKVKEDDRREDKTSGASKSSFISALKTAKKNADKRNG